MYYCLNSSLQEGTGRPVASNKATTCAELVLDVSPKTQRVILKKKVRKCSTWNLEEEVLSPGRASGQGKGGRLDSWLGGEGTRESHLLGLEFFLLSYDTCSRNSMPFSSPLPFWG